MKNSLEYLRDRRWKLRHHHHSSTAFHVHMLKEGRRKRKRRKAAGNDSIDHGERSLE